MFDGISLTEETIEYELKEMRKDRSVPVTIRNDEAGIDKQYYMITMDINVANFEFYSNGAQEGCYYLTSRNYLVKVNTKGEYVYYKNCGIDVHDFKRTEIDGEVFYSYMASTRPEMLPNYNAVSYKFASLHIMNERYEEIDVVKYLIPGNDIQEAWPLEMHDHIVLGKNHYMVCGMVPTYVSNIPDNVLHSNYQTRVMAAVIQEIKEEKLIWEWNSTDYPELYVISHESCDYTNRKIQWNDYCHLNSIEIDPMDGNILCTFRNADSLVKVDYKSGDILWVLGGNMDEFGLLDEQKFSGQHFARYIGENTITVWDNATNYICYAYPDTYDGSASGYPRAIKIELDEKDKAIVDYKEYNMGRRGGEFMGAAQSIDDGVYLLGWEGSVKVSNFAVFTEVDFKKENILFEAVVTANDYFSNYRVYKYKN